MDRNDRIKFTRFAKNGFIIWLVTVAVFSAVIYYGTTHPIANPDKLPALFTAGMAIGIITDILVGILAFIVWASSVHKLLKTVPFRKKALFLALLVLALLLVYRVLLVNGVVLNWSASYPTPTPGMKIALMSTNTPQPTVAETGAPTQTYQRNTTEFEKVDCTGPDGKHFQATFQDCVNFNNAWKGISPVPTAQPGAWGVATQVGEHTWTMKIGDDPKMATPAEIADALNNYRRVQGRSGLGWNDNLARFAQQRADDQAKAGKTDAHAGFVEYLKDQNHYTELGFNHLGENSSSGYRVSGVHLIEWVYAGDAAHNANQLDPGWTSIGVGVNGTVTDIIFGNN